VIIQVRGTSGSGKTTVMNRLMMLLGPYQPIHKDGRKKPLYYRFRSTPYPLVLGHYESPCGGCDTIGSARAVYDLIADLRKDDPTGDRPPILCEGLLLSEDVKWTTALAEWEEVRCVFLTTPLDTCLAQIGERRKAAGNESDVNPLNTTNRVATIARARTKLDAAGVTCVRASARQAPYLIRTWLTGEE
jgi:hypothetical protein